jgi:hypothetical protein
MELKRLGEVSGDFTRRWAQRRVHAVQRYGDILSSYGRGDLNATAAGEALTRLAAEEAVRYSEDTFTLGSDYVRAVLGLVGVSTGASAAPFSGASSRRIDIEVRGPLRGQATRTFLLENKQDITAEISFLVSDFNRPGSSASFRAPIEFVPARLTLRPQEERAVEVRLPLDDTLFEQGKTYRARVLVQGYNDLEIGLDVVVEPTSA